MIEDLNEFLLYADGVHKSYPDGLVHALNGVSLGVRDGEFVAITGPSGCGKSTLLNILGALDRPDSGEVFFRGEPLSTNRNLDSFRARQIGFVFQSFFLLPTLTALENIQIPMFEGERSSSHDRKKKDEELLELVGPRALANDPALLLADEPTGNLDSDNATHVLDLLATLRLERKLSLLIVTHSTEVAERADRIIRMRDGRVIEDSAPVTSRIER
jgi:putative ABC transport system ATP-binding protein